MKRHEDLPIVRHAIHLGYTIKFDSSPCPFSFLFCKFIYSKFVTKEKFILCLIDNAVASQIFLISHLFHYLQVNWNQSPISSFFRTTHLCLMG